MCVCVCVCVCGCHHFGCVAEVPDSCVPVQYWSLPDKTKRMSLNEKKMVHTLMSCTRGIVYDEDPGCIVESSCISVRKREGRTAS